MAQTHEFHTSILREYDIRGQVGDTLFEKDAFFIGRAFGTIVRRHHGETICVGRDGRLSSPALCDSLIEGLKQTGLHIRRLGQAGPTPMLYYAAIETDADAGIMVTGSHNPPDYNGFKLMLGKSSFHGRQIAELGRLAAAADFEEGNGSLDDLDIEDAYVARLSDTLAPIEEQFSMAVGWDPGNGATGSVVSKLANRLPGRHVVIYGDVDGHFPNHHPDPSVDANLGPLRELIEKENLDAGIGLDGDGDRIGVVDGKGRILRGDQILLLLARDILKDHPGATVIGDVKSSQVLFDGIKEAGGEPLMWRTGHSLIKAKMAEVGSPVSGELSGHIFIKDQFYGFDDAVYAGLRLLVACENAGRSLSELFDTVPQTVNTPEIRFEVDEDQKFKLIEGLQQRMRETVPGVVDIDGVRVPVDGGWWLLRASNTQPVLTARCEATDEKALEAVFEHMRSSLQAAGIDPPEIGP